MTHKFYETAKRAHAWTSFHPDKRAASECAYYDEIMQEFNDSPDVQAKFERLFSLSLAAKSRCASSAITGAARFPVDKQRAASERENKITGEMLAYIERVRAAKKKEAYYAENPEARPIMAGDEDALERLKDKLLKLEAAQERMKAFNKIVRKQPIDRAALIAIAGSEAAADGLLKPDCFGYIGFAPYRLTNNNAKIKATRERLAQLEKSKAKTSQDLTINGVRIVENREVMRLQLFFEGKPERKIITLLKSNAFKWAPSVMAWQRQLTENAIYSFRQSILPAISA